MTRSLAAGTKSIVRRFPWIAFCMAAVVGQSGCTDLDRHVVDLQNAPIPRELDKMSLPVYRVAPPDVLLIEAVENIRPAGTKIKVGDVVRVSLANPEPLVPPDPNATPIEQQFQLELEARFKLLNGEFLVQPDGEIELGPVYGEVRLAGLTVEAARDAIVERLRTYTRDDRGRPSGLKDPRVSVELPNIAGAQPVTGEHLVRPDGTVSLGIYGSVHVAGRTLDEVQVAVERHLSQFMLEPDVNVDVLGYNSQVYYVITDGGGFGEQVVRVPVTGNETVLDAISSIDGLSDVSSKNVWVARPSPAGTPHAQVLPVDYRAIAAEGITTTNYQLLPGDRVYIKADELIAADNMIAKVTAPIERIMGFSILTWGFARTTARNPVATGGFNNGNNNSGF